MEKEERYARDNWKQIRKNLFACLKHNTMFNLEAEPCWQCEESGYKFSPPVYDDEESNIGKDLPTGKKILCIDFDGVIHSYTSGWKGFDLIPDKPVEGAIAWLKNLLYDYRFEVCIFSSRNKSVFGIEAMIRWLINNGLTNKEANMIRFPKHKPAVF